MKYAFVFPGQGSQFVGMGKELAENFTTAKDVFNEVNEALGQDLYKVMVEGPDLELTLTTNTQPALMAVSMAIVRVLEKDFGIKLKDKASFVAGHSLGEYSAACAAGVFSLSDTAKLLRIRGNAMQQAVPVGVGGMAAVLGLSLGMLMRLLMHVMMLIIFVFLQMIIQKGKLYYLDTFKQLKKLLKLPLNLEQKDV